MLSASAAKAAFAGSPLGGALIGRFLEARGYPVLEIVPDYAGIDRVVVGRR